MDIDVHKSKESLERLENRINSLGNDSNSQLLKDYLKWHKGQIESQSMKPSSVNRSLQIALNIIDSIQNVARLETSPLERYWSKLLERKTIRKLPSGKIITLKNNLSDQSLAKLRAQTLKFYKFVKFRTKYSDKPINLFTSSSISKPDCCEFLNFNKNKKREDIRLPDQNKVKALIDLLRTSESYYGKMAGVLVAISNDCGLRFGEMINLRRSQIEPYEDFYLLHVKESKSAQRTVICALSKKILKSWLDSTSKKEDDLVFYPIDSNKSHRKKGSRNVIALNSLRKYFRDCTKKAGIELPKNKAFHLFRHCASSRLTAMPQTLKQYFMGWEMTGMESTYSHVDWTQCKSYYFQSLKGNPMLDFKLSEFDAVEEASFEDKLEEKMRLAVEKFLKEKGVSY